MEETENMSSLCNKQPVINHRLTALELRIKRLKREIELHEDITDKYQKQALIWEALYFGLLEEKLNQEAKKQA